MQKNFLYSCLLILSIILFGQCRPYTPIPKPRGYFHIDLPEKTYQTFDVDSFPYKFDYPVYAQITRDTNMVDQADNPFWINVHIPAFDATIYLSYKEITPDQPLERLVDESFFMTEKHQVRADYIRTPTIQTAKGYKGYFYEVGGNAASAYQFFISDEKTAAIRGALYFNVTPNADSLKPLYDFVRKDMDKLLETFEFKQKS